MNCSYALDFIVVCDSYLSERYMEKNGQMSEWSRVITFVIQACISIIMGER